MRHLNCLSLLLMLLLVGCSQEPKIEPAPGHVRELESLFDVKWPSAVSNEYSGAWNYRGRGNSFNTVVCARFDVSPSEFRSWRLVATNVLAEISGIAPTRDPSIVERFSWWDAHIYPDAKVICYTAETNALPDFLAKLKVFAVDKEGNYRMYVHAWILRR
jgi:hypothetical protein